MRDRSLVCIAALFVSVGCSSSNASSANAPDAATADAASADAAPPSSQDASDAAPERGDCDAYCDAVMHNCGTTGYAYSDNEACVAHCKLLQAGTVGDTSDTVGCREAYARAAASSDTPWVECAQAGAYPTACGAPCDSFCTFAVAECGDVWQGRCAQECAKWSVDADAGSRQEPSGNTLNCREYNVELAFIYGPAGDDDAGSGCASVPTASAECH